MARFESRLRKRLNSCAQTRRNVVSYPQTIQESLRSTHRLALLEPEKFHRVCQTKRRMHPNGCMSLSWVTQGFLRASTEHGKRVCPLSFPVIGKRALEEQVAITGTAAEGRVARPARPHNATHNGRVARPARPHNAPHNGRVARPARPLCDGRLASPTHLSERRHSKTLSFRISNPRNRLRPQARTVNQPRANKE